MAEATAAATVIFCPAPRRVTAARFAKNGSISSNPNEVGELDIKSSPAFYCGSPPCRPTNPMVDDPRFRELNSGGSSCNSSILKFPPQRQGQVLIASSPRLNLSRLQLRSKDSIASLVNIARAAVLQPSPEYHIHSFCTDQSLIISGAPKLMQHYLKQEYCTDRFCSR